MPGQRGGHYSDYLKNMFKGFIRKLVKSRATKPVGKPTSPATSAATPAHVTEPTLIPAQQHRIDPALVSANALRVTQTLQAAGYKAFIVGGAVRDLLLGIKPKDFDVATDATPEQVRRQFRRAFIIGKRFQIVHVMFGQDVVEVTTFRGLSDDSDKKDEFGRVLRDNTFGEQHEDAARRDFTINAMYYDPAAQTVLDYHGGMDDLQKKILRIIGVPELRYREDPVRMLRIVRFAAKLNFTIDPAARAPIPVMAPLINNVPAARVFDEMLKLLLGGNAMTCLLQLREEGLHHGLLPLLDVVLEQPLGEKFVTLALTQTDLRVKNGKSVSPGFLFAALLWHQVLEKWTAYRVSGEFPIPALHQAADDVLNLQTGKLALQRKICSDMREYWALQPRFDRRSGKAPFKLLEHPRFRGAYDFMQLRCESGEVDRELADWWAAFMLADDASREIMLAKKPKKTEVGEPARKRPARRSGRRRKKNAAETTSPSDAPSPGDNE